MKRQVVRRSRRLDRDCQQPCDDDGSPGATQCGRFDSVPVRVVDQFLAHSQAADTSRLGTTCAKTAHSGLPSRVSEAGATVHAGVDVPFARRPTGGHPAPQNLAIIGAPFKQLILRAVKWAVKANRSEPYRRGSVQWGADLPAEVLFGPAGTDSRCEQRQR